jgi:hypothetical protein
MPTPILVLHLGEVPKAEGALECAVTGAHVSLTTALFFARPCESNVDEVDFAASPTTSHYPMAHCTVAQLLIFTLFSWP